METWQVNLPIDSNLKERLTVEKNSNPAEFNMTLSNVNKV